VSQLLRRIGYIVPLFPLLALYVARQQPAPPIIGRWNLTVQGPRGPYASWLEVERSGFASLVGRFVGRIGGVRPIGKVEWDGRTFGFSIPPQWDRATDDLRAIGRIDGESLVGTIVNPGGTQVPFVGRRAPILRRVAPRTWGKSVALFNGRDLTGWTPKGGGGPSAWVVRDGILTNTRAEGANLATTETFQDFKLHVEFRHPPNGDGGVFLRGRYEVQINFNQDSVPSIATTGGVYSFLVPSDNMSTGAGTWQSMDITLVGRRVAVAVNRRTVIADQIIPGISGSALDSDEAAPGPIMLQGEETEIEFRNITIAVPAASASSK
jgi:hypothetical protein